jgi:hypothetical protein
MNSFASNSQIIAIHFGTPKRLLESALPELLPPNNWIGALLMNHILKGALLRAGILPPSGSLGCIGELTDCLFLAEVTDLAAAVEIIKGELALTPMSGMYQIAIPEGDGFRSIYPSPGARVNWLFDSERHESAHAKLVQSLGDFCTKMETFCVQSRAVLAVAGGAEKQALEKSIPLIQGYVRQARASLAPEQGGEENL